MSQQLINSLTQAQIKTDRTNFRVGDGVRVHTKVREGDKERIQIFSGIVSATRVRESRKLSRFAAFPTAKALFTVLKGVFCKKMAKAT